MKQGKSRIIPALIIILLFALVMTACGEKEETTDRKAKGNAHSESKEDQGADLSGETVFGEFETETLYGEEANQEVFTKAELTMVNIWGTFCGPCIKEMPELGELNREYADKGFQIVGIISDVNKAEDADAVEIVEVTEADFTHLILSGDLMETVSKISQVVPTTVFLDKEGKQVGEIYPGARSKQDWAVIVDRMLDEVGP